MNAEMSHEEYKAMLELEALDALDGAESRSLQQHLETCVDCRSELAGLRDTAHEFIYLTTPIPAPAELRGRLLEAISAPEMIRVSEVETADDNDAGAHDADDPSAV